MLIRDYFIHFLLSLSSVEYSHFTVLMPVFDLGDSFCSFGKVQSKPNLPNDGCLSERLIARLLSEAWEVLWPLQSLQAAVLSASQLGTLHPFLPPIAVDWNSIEFKSLGAWISQAAGPEALSNQDFYSYFNPREMPVFLCFTKAGKTVHTGW